MKDKETFKAYAEQLYYSEEYNQAIAELVGKRNINNYAKQLLKVMQLEQDAIVNARAKASSNLYSTGD